MQKLKLVLLDGKPQNRIDAIRPCNPVIRPSIYEQLKTVCTLPVSTATPKTMFSNFKRVNIYLRDTMKQVNDIFLL